MPDADTPQPCALRNEIEHAVTEAVSALPRGLRAYGREVARATLAGERTHGESCPQRPPLLDDSQAARVRIAIDAASDRARTAHLQPGTRVRVRCWPDELERDGTIEALHPGASAPITVRVDYPDGYREPGGIEPINPSNYPHERIVQPLPLALNAGETVTVRFIAQAWVNDNAIQVDAAGPTTFAVPVADAQDADGHWLADHDYTSDVLREHDNAPEWIRNWNGPFEVEIEHEGAT